MQRPSAVTWSAAAGPNARHRKVLSPSTSATSGDALNAQSTRRQSSSSTTVSDVDLHPFFAESRPAGRSRILKAAWGEDHAVYTATLLHLLRRLKRAGAVIVDASVESRETRALPKASRRLKIRDRELPIILQRERDLADLRSAIQSAEAAVKVKEGTSGGNPTRRLELVVEGTDGRWPGDDLQAHLIGRGRFVRRSIGRSSGAPALGETIPYRREAALPAQRERRKFDTNPDLQARGAAAHARAQNAVADILERYGLTPVAIRGGAAFDLGWDWNGVLNVLEVKSLTKANEERQLRLGLGQVLRYRDLVRVGGAAAKAWLVTERPPTDESWGRLCADLDVALTWPTGFEDELLTSMREGVALAPARRRPKSS